jgi:glyoxylase-like metal-dependent hydrolase (beta-lactamase superfamily II)
VRLVEQDRDEIVSYVRDSVPGHDLEVLGRLVPLPAGSDRIPWDGPAAQVIVHDGHAPGHAAVFLPQAGVLLAGDMLSDVEIPLPDLLAADPFGDYLAGLDRLAAVPGVRWLVPGHGHIADAGEFRRRLGSDYRYLDLLVAGEPFDDSRAAAGWLRDRHAEHVRRYASA